MLFCNCIISQTQDSIVYIVPDTIEIMLDKEIREIKSYDPDINIRFHLEKGADKMYTIFLIVDQDSSIFSKFHGRYILVDSIKYILRLDHDVTFASYDKKKVGEFGNRFNGLIPNNYYIMEGYSITFDRLGRNIKEDFGIQRKKKKIDEEE